MALALLDIVHFDIPECFDLNTDETSRIGSGRRALDNGGYNTIDHKCPKDRKTLHFDRALP
jgi:hypothetical protein